MISPDERVRQVLAPFNEGPVQAAALLCDTHAAEAVAYRIVKSDLSYSELTYRELRVESEKFAAALAALGVGPGDRVATLMGKSRNYLTVLMGIWRLGAVHVPLFTAFAPGAIALRVFGSRAKVILCDPSQEGKLAPSEDIPPDAPWTIIVNGPSIQGNISFSELMSQEFAPVATATLMGDAPFIHIYTSGTTGTPKGVVLPVRVLASFRIYAEYGYDLRASDIFWNGADPGWAYGLYYGVVTSLLTGVTSVLLEGSFSPELTLGVLATVGVTNYAAAPTVYRSLRAANIAVPPGIKLRCASSAGEPLTPDVNTWATTALGVSVYDHYGQTEIGMAINNHHHPLLRRPIKAGSMGHAMPGWTAVILRTNSDEPASPNEVGRVAFDLKESPLAWFDGYFEQPEKSAEKFSPDGRWYYTGDVGSMDEDGYLYFSSRDDDVILMAGYRIGPSEVESVMNAHPAVMESAAIAVPDEVRGELLECFVVLRDAAKASDGLANELQQWVKSRYAAHAYPRTVHFTAALPKTPSGKVQRVVLKQQRRDELKSGKRQRDT